MTKEYAKMQEEYFAAVESDNESLADKFAEKIYALQHAALYAACVRHLKNRGENQFIAAAYYADVAVSKELTPDTDHYEIPSVDTKHGRPVVIDF